MTDLKDLLGAFTDGTAQRNARHARGLCPSGYPNGYFSPYTLPINTPFAGKNNVCFFKKAAEPHCI